MQAERNFDCGRELSLQENAADLRRQHAIAKFYFVDTAKDDRRSRGKMADPWLSKKSSEGDKMAMATSIFLSAYFV